jgi:hypothetical protein
MKYKICQLHANGDPLKILTFVYSYHMGGWGDMLKGLHTAWCWAKGTNRTLRIDFSRHIFYKLFPQHQHSVYAVSLHTIDKLGQVHLEDVLKYNNLPNIAVTCNWFDKKCIGAVNPLPFFQELYTSIFPFEGAMPETPYHALHCRLGDQYLLEAYDCKNDNRIGSFEILKKVIEDYKDSRDRIMICGDHSSVIAKLLAEILNSFCLCPKPYHIAYANSNIEERLADIKAMILEHRALVNAASITMVSRSGFPITAAIHRNTPISIWKDGIKQPYTDQLTESFKSFVA